MVLGLPNCYYYTNSNYTFKRIILVQPTNKMLTDEQREILTKVHYHPKTGYTGIDMLKRKTKLSANSAKNYLLEQPTYTKHKPAAHKFKTRRVIVYSIDDQFQADLADMRSLGQYNDNYNYILTVIDILLKYA